MCVRVEKQYQSTLVNASKFAYSQCEKLVGEPQKHIYRKAIEVGNSYITSSVHSREKVVELYEQYIRSNPELLILGISTS